jgi:hypothetical protein
MKTIPGGLFHHAICRSSCSRSQATLKTLGIKCREVSDQARPEVSGADYMTPRSTMSLHTKPPRHCWKSLESERSLMRSFKSFLETFIETYSLGNSLTKQTFEFLDHSSNPFSKTKADHPPAKWRLTVSYDASKCFLPPHMSLTQSYTVEIDMWLYTTWSIRGPPNPFNSFFSLFIFICTSLTPRTPVAHWVLTSKFGFGNAE